MLKIKINGNLTPVVGVKEIYSVIQAQDAVLPNSVLSQNNESNVFDNEIKWFLYVLDRGSWRLTKGNEKIGTAVDFTFTQNSLKWKQMRMIVHAYGQKAMIAITPQKASEGKILDVQLLDANYSKPTRPFTYNDWIVARVYCIDMELQMLKVTLWEDDGDKTKQNTGNIKIEVKEAAIKNGTADVKFFLDPSHAWLANARLAPGDKNEGEFHEYYVTAEIFEKVSKRVASKNANVPNPDYKPPVSKLPIPAEQKGPSKKDEKGIAKSEKKVHDYYEEKVSVKNEVSTNPIMERINSLMTVDMGDNKWWEKKEECVCKEYDLIWGDKVSCDFRKKVVEIAKRLDKDPNLLMAAIALETGRTFSPTAGKGTNYVGLIQFGDAAAALIGTTRQDLINMNAIDQLVYVEKYLSKKKDELVTLADFYLSIIMPVDVGKGSTPNHVVFDNEYALKYLNDGKTLTDLSKSRHFGYRQNRTFLYEEGEAERVKKGGGKKYDGPGKTYIWEIERHVKKIYEEGKTKKVGVFSCKDIVTNIETELGTWNIVITEKYTRKKCLHEKSRNNCRRGIIEVFDHNRQSVLEISDCLLEGWRGEDRMKIDNDTPFGIYQINPIPFIMGSIVGEERLKYGPNPRLAFEPIKGSGDEADKSKRSLIRIHGGRQEDAKSYNKLTNAVLKRSSGCIRVFDSDAKRLYNWWTEFHRSNPNIKQGKVIIKK